MKSLPMVPLKKVLTKSEESLNVNPEGRYKQVTVQLWGKGVYQRNEVSGIEISSGRRMVVRSKQFILSRIDARNGAFGIIPEFLDGAVVSNDFPVFNLNTSLILPDFLSWMSKTSDFVEICRSASEGTTNRVRLKVDRFLDAEIPLPVPEEQRRIVARIEGLATRVEEARELQRRAVEETKALIKSYYKNLLDKISLDGRLSDVLLEKPKNGWSAKCDNADNGVPVLTLSAVTGFIYRENEFKRTSERTSPDAHYWLNKGDLLITRSNTPELVGHAAIYNGLPTPCIYPDLIMRLKVNEKQADTVFVQSWLRSSAVRQYIAKVAKGTSPTMKKISQKTVMDIPFPIQLSIQEQRRIVAYLDNLQTKADALKCLQHETAAELNALMPSILDRAFKGEL